MDRAVTTKRRRRTQQLLSRPWKRRATRHEGFTLIELMIALLILGIVLAALAPAFYGTLRASASLNQRSVANGLAVAATEQLRSLPYYEVGFAATPLSVCPTTTSTPPATPVVLPTGVPDPLDNTTNFPTSQTVPSGPGGIQYHIQRNVNWVDSSVSGATLAYKQSVVTVCWKSGALNLSVSQTSALYPGGEPAYNSGAGGSQNDYVPGATTTTTAPAPPLPPTAVTATDVSVPPTFQIQVSWPTVTSLPVPDHYQVLWSSTNPCTGTTGGTCTNGPSLTTLGSKTSSTQLLIAQTGPTQTTTITVGPATTYFFQVVSIAANQQSQVISPTAYTTSASPPPPQCTITGPLTITPSVGTNGGGVAVDNNGNLVNETSFGLAVNVSGPCTNVQVAYAPSACTPGATGCSTTLATMTGTTATWNGTAGIASTVWTVGTQIFTVFANGTPYSPLIQQQVIVCTQNGHSGKC